MKSEIPGVEKLSEEKLDKVANCALPIGANNILMGDDGPYVFGNEIKKSNQFSIEIEAETSEEAIQLFQALSKDGVVKMDLAKTAWAEKFGVCTDQYGVSWMVNYGEE